MAGIRLIIDIEVTAEELNHKQVGLIANSVVKAVNGPIDGQPEWYTAFCKNATFEPKTAKIWSVEKLIPEFKIVKDEKSKQF